MSKSYGRKTGGAFAMTVCDICKQEVSKRKTLSIGGGGRACRTHVGVQTYCDNDQAMRRENMQRDIAAERARVATPKGE